MSLPLRPCVGVALLNAEGLVFAGQRIDGFADAWQMPQGGIDKGEETEAAALRELEEETGVTADAVSQLAEAEGWHDYELPVDLIGKVWKGRYRGQTQKWYAYRLDAGDGAIDIAAGEEPEFRCWAWFRAGELLERIVPFKRDVYEKVFADFERWLA